MALNLCLIITLCQLLAELVCAGGGQARNDAHGDGREDITRREVGHGEQARHPQHAAQEAADGGQPLVCKRRLPDAQRGQISDDRDAGHAGDSHKIHIIFPP